MRNFRKIRVQWMIAAAFLGALAANAEDIQKFSFPLPADMTRADVYALKRSGIPRAILVLCPGQNGNGEAMLRQPEWRKFAEAENLGLIGLSFASKDDLLVKNRGYFYATQGSGQLLINAVQKIYGRDKPLLLYGFSGGAFFTSRFVEWQPGRVVSWCAYSGGWWDTPLKAAVNPPGIVACGDADSRYGATMIYFKQGRAAGKPWLWISLGDIGHSINPPLEVFIRNYFSKVLAANHTTGIWVDVDLNKTVPDSFQTEQPSLTGWLPDAGLFDEWKAINSP